MRNPEDLKQLMEQLKSKIGSETELFHKHETEVKELEEKSRKLDDEIHNMQSEIEIKRHELTNIRSKLPPAKSQLVRMQIDHQKTHHDLVDTEQKYTASLKQSNVKLHPPRTFN